MPNPTYLFRISTSHFIEHYQETAELAKPKFISDEDSHTAESHCFILVGQVEGTQVIESSAMAQGTKLERNDQHNAKSHETKKNHVSRIYHYIYFIPSFRVNHFDCSTIFLHSCKS